jgi:hypothetical protein
MTHFLVYRIKRPRTATAATDPFISPPSREQLMAGSASLRRVYKIEA